MAGKYENEFAITGHKVFPFKKDIKKKGLEQLPQPFPLLNPHNFYL